ncbi:MAG: polysaccharide lyase family protein [Chthonomonadales bacterium]
MRNSRPLRLLFAAAMGIFAVVTHRTSAAEPVLLWSIGRAKAGPAQFALFGRYQEYLARFPRDVRYVVGTSDPSRDWSFIQPGPDDAWAGSRPHTFTVQFALSKVPQDACRVDLELANTHYGAPPLLQIVLNGGRPYRYQLPPGADDRSLTDAHVGRPVRVIIPIAPASLREGVNTLAITTISGSWMLYDHIAMEAGIALPQEDVDGIQAESTPLFRSEGKRLLQAVRLVFNSLGTADRVEVKTAGTKLQQFAVQPGANTVYVLVPPFQKKEARTISISLKAGSWHSVVVEGRPERHWRVYVVPSSHTDIGYTDLQERVFERHNENTLKALEACARDASFRWNLEVAAQADFLKDRNLPAFRQLMRRIREGRIGLPGLYLNMLTGLCDGEELIASVRRSHELARSYGFRVEAANLTDVPTSVGTLPMVLAKSGIRYFAEGVNQDRGPLFAHADRRMRQSPFWWEWFDGSRVLAWLAEGYAQASALGLTDNADTLGQRLTGWLRSFDRPDYPSDAVFVYGAFSDNQPMTPRYARVAEEWNRTWEYPKIIVSTEPAFFHYVEATVGRKLPVFRGDLGTYWEDGAGSSALETALVRWARARLEQAQRWNSMAVLAGAPLPQTSEDASTWRNLLFYDEHTWGAWCSISQPQSEQTVKQWAFKAAFAHRAAQEASQREAQAVGRLAAAAKLQSSGSGDARSQRTVVVWNPHSWTQDCVAWVPAQASEPVRVRDRASKAWAPAQWNQGRLYFVARRVPPCGWRAFVLEEKGPAAWRPVLSPGSDAFTWKTKQFQLRLDPVTGGIASLKELRTGREWVDGTSPYKLNQFLYVLGGDNDTGIVHPGLPQPKLDIRTHTKARVRLIADGPVLGVLEITRQGDGLPSCDTTLTFDALGNLVMRNVIHKPMTLLKEAGYFAFPFRLQQPRKAADWVDLPYGVVQVEKEQLPGACREWYTANSFAAVSDGSVTAYLATPHAPLITVGDIFRGAWRAHISASGTLFSYVFNNYWHTNYKAGQGGDLVFSYALRLTGGAFDAARAVRFGWAALDTMEDPREAYVNIPATLCVAAHEGVVAPAEGSLFGVSLPVMAAETYAGGSGLVARLYNPSFHAARAVLAVPKGRIGWIQLLNLMGEPIADPRPVGATRTEVTLGPRSIITLKLGLIR